jgi:L-cysteine S-thiosulfotransferase
MRFPEILVASIAALAAATPSQAFANAEQVRADIVARVRERHPDLSFAELALGSAAFDAQRRAELEGNTPVPETADIVEAGKRLWAARFRNGRSLAGCFPNGGRRIAAAYPQYDQRLKRIVTLETAINQCLKTHGQPLLDPADPTTMGAILAYLRPLSDGQKIAVRVASQAAEERFDQGRRLYFTRMGQQNFACASCHLQNSGRRYADAPLSAAVGQAAHWPVIREARAITLQMQIRDCMERMGAAPFPAGSDEIAHLEYFLAYLSNGLALKANVWRTR